MRELLNCLYDPHFLNATGRIAAGHELDGNALAAGVDGLPDIGKASTSAELHEFQAWERLASGFQSDTTHDRVPKRQGGGRFVLTLEQKTVVGVECPAFGPDRFQLPFP